MREIKFRAWDKTTKSLIKDYARIGSFGELYTTQFHRSAYSDDACPDLVLEQYTGRKDRDGKEVYEGDIIKGLHDFGPGGWHTETGVVEWTDDGYKLHYWNGFKVIGNIYEHKHLLDET